MASKLTVRTTLQLATAGVAFAVAALVLPHAANAADLTSPYYAPASAPAAVAPAVTPPILSPWYHEADQNLFDPHRMDIKFGGFYHGLGSAEDKTADVKLELDGPRFFPNLTGWWTYLIPRPYISGVANLDGRTSSARAGMLWDFQFTNHWFGEIFFGGAVHNGSINGTYDANGLPNRAALGAHYLFNIGGSLGYRLDQHWSVMVTFDHLSNGKSVFDLPYVHNQGINSYGAQVSYAFGPFF